VLFPSTHHIPLTPRHHPALMLAVDWPLADVLCRAVLCCAVLCCAVLCCAVLSPPPSPPQSGPNVSGEGINLGPIKEGSSADSYLLPEDLVHLTRRSLFLIIDSDNSNAFSKLQVGGGEGGSTQRNLLAPQTHNTGCCCCCWW